MYFQEAGSHCEGLYSPCYNFKHFSCHNYWLLEISLPIERYSMKQHHCMVWIMFTLNFMVVICDAYRSPHVKKDLQSGKDFYYTYAISAFFFIQSYNEYVPKNPLKMLSVFFPPFKRWIALNLLWKSLTLLFFECTSSLVMLRATQALFLSSLWESHTFSFCIHVRVQRVTGMHSICLCVFIFASLFGRGCAG